MRHVVWMALVAGACIPRFYGSGDTGLTGDWVAPENSWPVATPPPGLVGEGYDPGQTLPDLRLQDQFGDEVSLWQFHGSVVLFDISTIWCAPCQALAMDTEATWQDYQDQGFVYVTVLQEDLEGNPPNTDDLNLWVDNFGITAPVLGDGDKLAADAIRNGAWPAVLLIDRDMVVAERIDAPTADSIREAVLGAL